MGESFFEGQSFENTEEKRPKIFEKPEEQQKRRKNNLNIDEKLAKRTLEVNSIIPIMAQLMDKADQARLSNESKKELAALASETLIDAAKKGEMAMEIQSKELEKWIIKKSAPTKQNKS